ncbi:hypothetical protein [Acinetobacter radioresistens]|uniref:hypothetical protein n=1 Tax=Acinetobacter radioresistens TaxID=40216 RepID=UPI002002FA1C|nr:hypothetical protein [Acinetobacter radioresistens]MCK4077486.1 hypothetical protein [Acinetobacter radioresistens]
MENLLALSEFFKGNNLKSDSYGNYKFNAKVTYKSRIKNVVEFTKVKIIMAGYNGGKISITETNELSSDEFHLDFVDRFQEYSYNNALGELVVVGESPKMAGKYTVDIAVR